MTSRHFLYDRVGSSRRSTPKRTAAMAAALVLVLSVLVSAPTSAHAATIEGACNCVVLRVDDIQDYYLNSVQTDLLNHLMSKNVKVSAGVIMNFVGNDKTITDLVTKAKASGNFELANHGWNHVDYRNLTAQDQHDTLQNGDSKMNALWGVSPTTFITPFNVYNEDTLAALQALNMKVISAEFDGELPSVYNPDDPTSADNQIFKAIPNSHIVDSNGVAHLPQGIGYHTFGDGSDGGVKTPLSTIESSIDNQIASYGYAVITLHPQDFAVVDGSNQPTNQISSNEVADLDTLLNYIQDKGYTTKTFSQVVQGDWSTSGGNNGSGDGSGNGTGNGTGSGTGNTGGQGAQDSTSNTMIRLVSSMMDKAKKIGADGIPSDDKISNDMIKYRMFDLSKNGGPEFEASLYLTDMVPSIHWNHMTEKQQIYYIEKMLDII
jgi:peptidoglycan/xylan/chitin deacetylase (PgdA/CDA1 family)